MQDEKKLIERLKVNDKKAFVELMNAYQNYVYSIAYNILKNPAEAQEAAQDCFIKVHRSIGNFLEGAKLSTWLYKIAYHTALDYQKKNKMGKLTDTFDHGNNDLSDAAKNALHKMEYAEQKQSLQNAISQLKIDEATVISLFYLKELSLREICEITEMTESNVKIKLYRARKALYQLMKNKHEFQTNY